NLYITGKTYSSNFPVFNAYDSTYNAGEDVFVTKMDQNGIIAYSTYIGGSVATMTSAQPHEIGNDITVDADGNVYVAGNTKSDDFPRVNPMFSYPENQSILRGEYNEAEGDAFVLKLNSTGHIEYSTYFGGTNGDLATSIALDVAGNIYIGGRTSSDDLPLVNPIDTANNLGNYDGFISCISADGSTILFSTFFGGSQNEIVNDIAIDDSGSLIAIGNTLGGLSLINPIYSSYGGGGVYDAFVLKID
ncbi:MAG: SBBP repeat-containing protein, partial [Candidatus Thorarchaeota archaeon]